MSVKLPSLRDILNTDIDYLKGSQRDITTNITTKDNSLSLKNISLWNEMNENLSLLSSVSLNYTYDSVLKELKPITLPSISTLPFYSPATYSTYSPTTYSSPYYTPPSLVNSPSPTSSPRLENTKIKRRQRLGPSCDCCRKRKVKCDADITVVADFANQYDYSALFSLQEWNGLISGASITRASYIYLVSFGKLIKFKPCSSCNSKNLACVFSKGFTKDDLLKKKKTVKEKQVKVVKKVVKSDFNLRKSSCVNCRKRKVKCVGGEVGCTGCEKKGVKCEFT